MVSLENTALPPQIRAYRCFLLSHSISSDTDHLTFHLGVSVGVVITLEARIMGAKAR